MGTIYRNGVPFVGSGGAGGVEMTQAEYDLLPESEKMNGAIYFITDGDVSYPSASQMRYDNTESQIPSTTVQGAIDELKIEIGNTNISSIGDGTVTGAVNALNNGLMWKQLASGVSSSVGTSLSSVDYRELLLVARLSNAAYSVIALKAEIDAGETLWSSGVFFRSNTWIGVQFGYSVGTQTITLSYANNSGTDVLSTSTYSVYYR